MVKTMDSKNKLKGLVIRLNNDRLQLLTHLSEFSEFGYEHSNKSQEFSEPTNEFSYSRNLPLTCFLMNNQAISLL